MLDRRTDGESPGLVDVLHFIKKTDQLLRSTWAGTDAKLLEHSQRPVQILLNRGGPQVARSHGTAGTGVVVTTVPGVEDTSKLQQIGTADSQHDQAIVANVHTMTAAHRFFESWNRQPILESPTPRFLNAVSRSRQPSLDQSAIRDGGQSPGLAGPMTTGLAEPVNLAGQPASGPGIKP